MKKPEPGPVVTMDDSVWDSEPIFIDGAPVGELGWTGDTMTDPAIWVGDVKLKPAELRALADFLDQLAGANLLSGVAGGDDE